MLRKVKLNLKSGKSGQWTLRQFTVSEENARRYNLREMYSARFISPDTYWGLYRDDVVVMSNTPAEINDHYPFIMKATGKVLIGGLGLGMVLKCLLDKPEITKVTVVEKSPDVINLVASAYISDPRVEIVNADIFEYRPEEHYDCAWFDIWDDITGDEYLDMKKLHRRYGRYVGWSDSWLRKKSMRLYKENQRIERMFNADDEDLFDDLPPVLHKILF